MAKLSSINKNERRKKLVKKYAGRYARLKAVANDKSKESDARAQPLRNNRASARLLSQIPSLSHSAA
jgi:hypothetical protein